MSVFFAFPPRFPPGGSVRKKGLAQMQQPLPGGGNSKQRTIRIPTRNTAVRGAQGITAVGIWGDQGGILEKITTDVPHQHTFEKRSFRLEPSRVVDGVSGGRRISATHRDVARHILTFVDTDTKTPFHVRKQGAVGREYRGVSRRREQTHPPFLFPCVPLAKRHCFPFPGAPYSTGYKLRSSFVASSKREAKITE